MLVSPSYSIKIVVIYRFFNKDLCSVSQSLLQRWKRHSKDSLSSEFGPITVLSALATIMTSLDFRKMMKEAKAKANKHVAEPETTDDAMKLSEPLVSSEAPQDWVVERFDYNMQEEIERFHEIYAKWQVGNIDHVYYMPNFVSEEEEATLLSNVRNP